MHISNQTNALPFCLVDVPANFFHICLAQNNISDPLGADKSPENVHSLEHVQDIREDVGGKYFKHPYDTHADEDFEVLEEPFREVFDLRFSVEFCNNLLHFTYPSFHVASWALANAI